jgi:hypothetical protein
MVRCVNKNIITLLPVFDDDDDDTAHFLWFGFQFITTFTRALQNPPLFEQRLNWTRLIDNHRGRDTFCCHL